MIISSKLHRSGNSELNQMSSMDLIGTNWPLPFTHQGPSLDGDLRLFEEMEDLDAGLRMGSGKKFQL